MLILPADRSPSSRPLPLLRPGMRAGRLGGWMRMLAFCVKKVEGLILAAAQLASGNEAESVEQEVELLGRIGGGDQGAMAVLYDRYAASVHALGIRMLRDAQGAEDIVQETFWRVWKTADGYERPRGAPGAWIYGIGRNVAIDMLRRKSVRPPSAADEAEKVIPEPDPGGDATESAAMDTLQRERIRAAMRSLSDVQREVIELAYFGGLTRKEIAERTGAPIGTVHTRARLALNALSEQLATELPGQAVNHAS